MTATIEIAEIDLDHNNAPLDAPASANAAVIDVNALFVEHYDHLLLFVKRYLRNSEDAEDVVQNTFAEAVRCGHRFSGLSKPSTWLFGIALNLARNQVRRNCADRYETVDENFMEQLVDPCSDPATVIEARQLNTRINALLGNMLPKIRSTFEAVLQGDMTYEMAAEHMQVPIGTVRSRVSRVRATVRSQFGEFA
ncbi:RNA polymerase sigma factor, sigma-70 family protein [Janthinobacterium agaricidamnosum NBRC 102515 = DSM 9628]|uniref:RNA polymerase sigma factor, sigma-70 family protein n=2 Tax=Janthinobacterium agaricidamnosum TaxID=55508 RepID=W0V0G6_9BURK|nr:RNA polymerase sigma factor, sigma-70 family protein [Janthinobacterium agaricidamnosum NBRC 102515 = DSM 9628]